MTIEAALKHTWIKLHDVHERDEEII